MPLQLLVGVVLGSLVLAAFLSLGEAAFLGFSRVRRRQLLEENDVRIGAVERLLDRPQQFLIGVLTLSTLAAVAGAVAATLAALELAALRGWSEGGAVAGAVVAFALAHVVLTQLVPKAYGTRFNEGLSLRLAPSFRALLLLVAPLTFLLERFTDRVYLSTGATAEDGASHFRSEEELKTLITLGTEEGILEEDEEEMIHSVIEFGETTAKEIMVSRVDVSAVPAEATLDHVRAFVLEGGYSRLPVYQGSLDNVVGVLYAKDMLVKLLESKGATQVKELMKEPFYVPETKKVSDLLDDMQAKRVHFAVVLDEYGVTAGIITLEDILEEIVGEIYDEYEPPTDAVRRIDEDTAVVDARTHVSDVNDALGLGLPEDGPFDTVGGFVFHKLGRLGKEGEVVRHNGFQMVVEKVANRRILRVRVVRTKADADEPSGGARAEREA